MTTNENKQCQVTSSNLLLPSDVFMVDLEDNHLLKITCIQRSWRAGKLRRVINTRVDRYLKYGEWPTLTEAKDLHMYRTQIRRSALHQHYALYSEDNAITIQRVWRGCAHRMDRWIRSGPDSRRTFQPCMDCGGTASSIKTHDYHPRCDSCEKCYEIDACPICLSELLEKDICVTECGHDFHFSCLFKSLLNNPGCPLCRNPLTDRHFTDIDAIDR